GAQALGESEPDAPIAVFGHEVEAEAVRHRKVAALGVVHADHRPAYAGPQMPVRIDEAGHADHVAGIDGGNRWGVDCFCRPDDGAVSDVHVTAREIADPGVQGKHGCATDYELAARGQRCRGATRYRVPAASSRLCE